jgi:hypothetical protein
MANFTAEPRNIRLGLALDELNPYVNLVTNHSTWPILLFNYNLSPWLTTKRLFVMMVLLILGKESIKNDNINVYLQSLVQEFKKIWEMINTIDVTRLEGSNPF